MSNVIPFSTPEREQQRAINKSWADLLKRASNWDFEDLEIAESELHQPTEDPDNVS